jgi:hypothetical protein
MKKPQLMYTSPNGGTVHSYDIEGGKQTFHHYLACKQGECKFYPTLDEARIIGLKKL